MTKTSKVWFFALVGGLIGMVVGVFLVKAIGGGAGAVVITSGLAGIGGAVGGGMLAGIGLLASGAAATAATSAAIAHKTIKDERLLDLEDKLKTANELYEASKRATESQKQEIASLNKQIGDILNSNRKNQEEIDDLKGRLLVIIRDLQSAA